MKKSQLKQLIREEIKRVLNEDMTETPLDQLQPGQYKVTFTVENRDSWDSTTYTLTPEDIASGELPYGFWRGIAMQASQFFGKGDKVTDVEPV
jgi:hypothetical protein